MSQEEIIELVNCVCQFELLRYTNLNFINPISLFERNKKKCIKRKKELSTLSTDFIDRFMLSLLL